MYTKSLKRSVMRSPRNEIKIFKKNKRQPFDLVEKLANLARERLLGAIKKCIAKRQKTCRDNEGKAKTGKGGGGKEKETDITRSNLCILAEHMALILHRLLTSGLSVRRETTALEENVRILQDIYCCNMWSL